MTTGLLAPLAWDTAHFGFPVARLLAPGGDPEALGRGLEAARRGGATLVYWEAGAGVPAPGPVLGEFTGRLVDRKVTYALDPLVPNRGGEDGGRVREHPPGPASEELRALAVAAGAFSRFRVDPLVPEDKFVGLYTIWVERSARREIADAVLVAGDEGGPLAGMVTLAEEGGAASVGLVAVAEAARGRGVGRSLMAAAHRWMAGRGARRATVVTQQDNAPACRLYERCGYRPESVKLVYHFWPCGGGAGHRKGSDVHRPR